MTIRLATLAEIDTLNALVGQAVRELSAGYYTPAQIDSALRYVFGIDTQLIHDGTYYVAEIGGQLAGCGGWSCRRTLYGGDQSKITADPLLDPAQEAGRIRAFFVQPQFARQGVGRAILVTCEAVARKAGFKQLDLASTLPGEPLYRALGYTPDESMSIPFPDGQSLPLIRMHKLLP